jgi:DNA-binding transcriptional ArsR family regulator
MNAQPAPAPVPKGDPDVAAIGALLSDGARCRVLMALDDGRELPASVLAAEAGVSRPTTSAHLARLTQAGMLAVRTQGRHRYYRIASPEVGRLLESMAALAPDRPVRSLREGTRAAQLRTARTCYDHLAGRLGVSVMSALLDAGYLRGGDGEFDVAAARHDRLSAPGHDIDYTLTEDGARFLAGLGVGIPGGRRRLVRYCVDWSEQRHHLGGRLGRALLDHFLHRGWVRRRDVGRALKVTPAGRAALTDRFGIDWS